MTAEKTADASQQNPFRLWPGLAAATLLLICKLLVPIIMPDSLPVALLGGLVFSMIILLWWMFFSRIPRLERWGAVALIVMVIFAVRPLLHKSIAQGGMGMLFFMLSIPWLSLSLVAWAIVSHRYSELRRRITLVLVILVTVGCWLLIRTGGLNNQGQSDFAWRWSPSPEEQLLAKAGKEPTARPAAAADYAGVDWPGFRGADRDAVVRGVRIKTDWSAAPPKELWRRPVGPGWSSFAVAGNLFYTQEQRGEQEVVACYDILTGELVWKHSDQTRFWESNGGAGPRATPTLQDGRAYTMGATGIVNVLDAGNGNIVWSRNAGTDTDTKVPLWGFSGSPLVMNDMVVVAAAGSLISYDLNTGKPRWSKPAGGDCYSSPHLVTIGGVEQILLQNEVGVISVAPADGKQLWQYGWAGHPIVQPILTADGDILASVDYESGMRRIAVTQEAGVWATRERWSSLKIKPYFNDSVIHNGFVYGFDGSSLTCIDLQLGSRKWKGGRYGRGQFVLLADQDLLLVLSEKGDLALVKAMPEQFTEIARCAAIKGKTWNHPVVVNDIVLVRNAEEMAAFRLTLAGI